MSKLDQIRAVGSCEMVRRFGAPTPRKPGPAIPGVARGLSTPVNTVNTQLVHTPQPVNSAEDTQGV